MLGGEPNFPVNWTGGEQWRPIPEGKGPKIPRRMDGRWDEGSVEYDLSFIEQTKKLLDNDEDVIRENEVVHIKKRLRRELMDLCWEYNRGATLKANFPLRNKYLIFDSSFINKGALDIHRIKIAMSHNHVSDYKLMKWVPYINK
jgi:hypothetical protein